MARTSISIKIARNRDEVWAFMADMANMTAWTNMVRMDLDGDLAEGTTGSFDLPMLGRRRTFPFVITAYQPGHRWAIQITSRLGVEFDYTLESVADGTRIDQLIDAQPTGLLRPLAPLLARMMREEEQSELRRLKAALENGPAAGGRKES